MAKKNLSSILQYTAKMLSSVDLLYYYQYLNYIHNPPSNKVQNMFKQRIQCIEKRRYTVVSVQLYMLSQGLPLTLMVSQLLGNSRLLPLRRLCSSNKFSWRGSVTTPATEGSKQCRQYVLKSLLINNCCCKTINDVTQNR